VCFLIYRGLLGEGEDLRCVDVQCQNVLGKNSKKG